jgi:hypothetical protein
MTECIVLRRDMLKNPVQVQVDDDLDFARAKELADREARKKSADPMLLAWYNGRTGQFSPMVECGAEDKPAWLVYAESRGGDICIDINDEEYVFVYRASW